MSNEAIPKSAARVLNAMKVQGEYRMKRRGEDDGTQGKPKKRQRTDGEGQGRAKGKAKHNLKILPGESLAHFNRYVSDCMGCFDVLLTVLPPDEWRSPCVLWCETPCRRPLP